MSVKTQTEINRGTVNDKYTQLNGISQTKRVAWFSKRRFGNI